MSLTNWLAKADVGDGVKPGITTADNAQNRDLRKRVAQGNEVLRRAAANLSQANLPGSVKELVAATAPSSKAGTTAATPHLDQDSRRDPAHATC